MTRLHNSTDLSTRKTYHTTRDINRLLHEPVKLNIILNNKTIFLSRYFCDRFGSLPKAVYLDDHFVLYLLESYQLKLLRTRFTERCSSFKEKFTGKHVLWKKYSETLGDLVINLFSQVKHMNMIDLEPRIEQRHDENELQILLKMLDHQMPLALGRKGNYIHFINRVFTNVTFTDSVLNEKIDCIRIYLRS